MAHVLGVPKRDFCKKCKLPVFLAERMAVGNKIYHRTCLKCARCHSQLTPGNFYETEVDDEYCCETCPDEEEPSAHLLRSQENYNGPDVSCGVRTSIAGRLAFFEKSEQAIAESPGLKNISDEEKSQSLQRLGNAATVSQSAFRMNPSFNDFLNSDVNEDHAYKTLKIADVHDEEPDKVEAGWTSLTSTASGLLQSETSMKSPTEAPQIPISPPETEQSSTTFSQSDMNLTHDQHNLCENNEMSLPKMEMNNNPSNLSYEECNEFISTTETRKEHDDMNNNGEEILQRATEFLEVDKKIEIENKIYVGENYVTKDYTENYQILITNDKNIEAKLLKDLRNLKGESYTDEEECENHKENEDSEEIGGKTNDNVATIHRLSVVCTRLQQLEINNNSEAKEKVEQDNLSEETMTNAPLPITTEKPEQVFPTTVSSKIDIDQKFNFPKKQDESEPFVRHETKEAKSRKILYEKITIEEYPKDLNPFKSDDENDESEENKKIMIIKKKYDNNPFDSSDDEIELEKSKSSRRTPEGKVPPPRPPPPRAVRNPFEEQDNFSQFCRPSASLNKRTPVPTPRANM